MFACLCESVERMPNVHGQPICFNPIGWRSHPWQTCMLVGALSIVSLCSVKIKDVSTNKGKKRKKGWWPLQMTSTPRFHCDTLPDQKVMTFYLATGLLYDNRDHPREMRGNAHFCMCVCVNRLVLTQQSDRRLSRSFFLCSIPISLVRKLNQTRWCRYELSN